MTRVDTLRSEFGSLKWNELNMVKSTYCLSFLFHASFVSTSTDRDINQGSKYHELQIES